MSQPVTSRVFMQAIADGESVHASLVSTDTLSQGYNPTTGTASPSWSGNNQKPLIYAYVTLGATKKTVSQSTWYYNGVQITWSSVIDQSRGGYPSTGSFAKGGVPMFYRFNAVSQGGSGVSWPGIKINTDLASSTNLDSDIIRLEGSVEVSGTQLSFACEKEIRLYELTSSGQQGILSFLTSNAYIETKFDGNWSTAQESSLPAGSYVKIRASLSSGGESVSDGDFHVMWSLNGADYEEPSIAGGEPVIDLGGAVRVTYDTTNGHCILVGEPAVTDITVVSCRFIRDGNTVDTVLVTVDDLQDPEYMWKSRTINDGASDVSDTTVTLRRGQTVTWSIWMGKQDDPSYVDATWNKLEVLPLDIGANTIPPTGIATFSSLSAGADGWINITSKKNATSNKYVFPITFNDIIGAGGNIECLLRASQVSS